MIPIFEQVLAEGLTGMLAALLANPSQIDDIFGESMSATMLADLQAFILREKIHVVQPYPRSPAELPCYAIMVASDAEKLVGLGEEAGEPVVPDPDESLILYPTGSVWHATYRITCWHDNAQGVRYLYYLARYFCQAFRATLQTAGLSNVTYAGGDLQPKPEWFPSVVFGRAVEVSGDYDAIVMVPDTRLVAIDSAATVNDPVWMPGRTLIAEKYTKIHEQARRRDESR